MRVRTEDRRQAIIEVAGQVFRDVGFERASMDMISRRLGGSKGTLYGYFQSKEELFETAMMAAIVGPGDQIMGILAVDTPDLRDTLENFGVVYLEFVLGDQVLAITRTAIAEGATASLGPHLFELGPRRALLKLEEFFSDLMTSGQLRNAPARVAAIHFKGLIEAGFLEEALYDAPVAQQIGEAVPFAVDTFLRAYGAELTSANGPMVLAEAIGPRPDRSSSRPGTPERDSAEITVDQISRERS